MKSLYVTDRAAVGDGRFEAVLRSLGEGPGGPLVVQLREKEEADRDILGWAGRIRTILSSGSLLFVNRRFDLTVAASADGVHLPADGIPVSRVRANAPRGLRIGVSTHSAHEAAAAIDEGADLVVLGPIFVTPSKSGLGDPLGPGALEDLPKSDTHAAEVFAIGGMTEENVEALLPWRDRIAGVAGIRLFQETSDPAAVVQRLAAR